MRTCVSGGQGPFKVDVMGTTMQLRIAHGSAPGAPITIAPLGQPDVPVISIQPDFSISIDGSVFVRGVTALLTQPLPLAPPVPLAQPAPVIPPPPVAMPVVLPPAPLAQPAPAVVFMAAPAPVDDEEDDLALIPPSPPRKRARVDRPAPAHVRYHLPAPFPHELAAPPAEQSLATRLRQARQQLTEVERKRVSTFDREKYNAHRAIRERLRRLVSKLQIQADEQEEGGNDELPRENDDGDDDDEMEQDTSTAFA